MNIPLNGRIAIVDDNFTQAYPLMELFGQLRMPYLYYRGDLKSLPEENNNLNDIRILFLDIYLTGDSIKTDKQIKSSIFGVLNRLISEKNYPYLLIYWSRHESEHRDIIKELFSNELKKKAPIEILTLQKSDYFTLTGEKTEQFEENMKELLSRIEQSIATYSIFQNLVQWENLIHISADKTLENIFLMKDTALNWDSESKYLFYKLGSGFAGKNFKDFSSLEQIRSAFYCLNYVFNDSLEYNISSEFNGDYEKLDMISSDDSDTLYALNKKLLLSDGVADKYLPGMVYKCDIENHNYGEIVNFCLSRNLIFHHNEQKILEKLEGENDEQKRKRIELKIFAQFKDDLKKECFPIEVNVTPVCDYFQCKQVYFRIIPGLLIKSKYYEYVNKNTDALFISPIFNLKNENDNFFFLLDFRFFTSLLKKQIDDKKEPWVKLRQSLLAEVQSKLARHVNRQGILFLEV